MSTFKVKDLLVDIPSESVQQEEEYIGCLANTRMCIQVTLPRCVNHTGGIGCVGDTLPEGCRLAVTQPRCINDTLEPECINDTVVPEGCQQVTLPRCFNDTVQPECINDTVVPEGCRQVTLPDCGPQTGVGSASTGDCSDDCGTNAHPPSKGPGCCGGGNTCEVNTDSQRYNPITSQLDQMRMEDLARLKRQMRFLIDEIEKREKNFEPQSTEEIDQLEEKMEAGLEELQRMRDELEGEAGSTEK
jgi:hypothetical protein